MDEGLTDVGGLLEFEDPKSLRGFRTVPLADLAVEKLRDHVEAGVGWKDERALLFGAPDGSPLRPNNWRPRYFKRRGGAGPATAAHPP